jgi:pimeloyl-ACP methyl ester carboxylesterase
MMKTLAFVAALALFATTTTAEESVELKTPTGSIYGTLVVPKSSKPMPVVLLIAGSGPTDRNGNTPLIAGRNRSLELLAEALAARNIASLRYDKRGIGESKAAMTAEKDLRFDTYVDDAVAWANQLSKDARFTGVVIAGHSEGALIGTIAAEKAPVIGFVSIAGAGAPADTLLRRQLAGQLPPELAAFNDKALTALKSGRTVEDVPAPLLMLYRASVQPYLISWLRFDPAAEIAKVKVPVLIVQGTTDIQVAVDDARALNAARAGSKLEIIEGMNHVLKMVPADLEKQIASYGDPSLALAPRLVDAIATFVNQLAKPR